ncbi:MAG: adenylate/guanylate cyclase domain-containing protein [Methylococcaceae bacterium]|jgi:class 3 adenylate cyclase
MTTLQPKQIALLIADICGSTALYESIGDNPARLCIQKALATMVGEVTSYDGKLVNAIGDQIMCAFPDPKLALDAACAMQNAIKSCTYGAGYSLKIRIGVHYGEVILGDDVAFGDTVNVTARIAAIASANQITTSRAVYNALPKELKEKTLKFMQAHLKGKVNPFDIYLVLWEQEEGLATCFNIPPSRALGNADELSLLYCGSSVKINKTNKVASVGRNHTCDIIVRSIYASRQHFRCEYRLGKFFLVDQSINGTYICLSDKTIITLVREEMILKGTGAISLGHNAFDTPTEVVEFSVLSG